MSTLLSCDFPGCSLGAPHNLWLYDPDPEPPKGQEHAFCDAHFYEAKARANRVFAIQAPISENQCRSAVAAVREYAGPGRPAPNPFPDECGDWVSVEF